MVGLAGHCTNQFRICPVADVAALQGSDRVLRRSTLDKSDVSLHAMVLGVGEVLRIRRRWCALKELKSPGEYVRFRDPIFSTSKTSRFE